MCLGSGVKRAHGLLGGFNHSNRIMYYAISETY
jgi:hypothetical protein